MLEILTMAAFTAVLIACVAAGQSVVYALVIGYVIFFVYGLKKGHSAGQVLEMSKKGIMTSMNILVIFFLIGMLTALWRACGTIPVIVCYSAQLIHPAIFVMLAFLLNCLVSVLTGTSFGTAATMGVICMSMARSMGQNEILVGGAIISGLFFGDRCSPVSSSALLVSTLTETDIYENIRGMVRTTLVPFFITCAIYGVLGIFYAGGGEVPDMTAIYAEGFRLHWVLVLPAAVILVLSAFHVHVKKTMAVSIVLAALLCLTVQGAAPAEMIRWLVFGYRAENEMLGAMINGGGIVSMLQAFFIVGISSSFAGIFEGTGLLKDMKRYIVSISGKITPFGCITVVSAVASMIACNQTLASILTYQLCHDVVPDRKQFALDLENTVIVLAALVPWSIAGSVPAATLGVPMVSLAAACYLYLVPFWNLIVQAVRLRGSRVAG